MLNKLFNPQSIALIGATDRENSVGLGIVNNLLNHQNGRKIFLINPKRKIIRQQKVYSRISEIEEEIDLVIIAVPAKIVPQVVNECCQKKVGSIIIISAGFSEANEAGAEMEKNMIAQCQEHNIPVVGPNCLGIISPANQFNASFAPLMPKAGNIALASQSGALLDSIIDSATKKNYGFSYLISYGNAADLSLNDYLEFLGEDNQTKVIGLYIEGLKKGRQFLKIARKISQRKRIIALKAGRTQKGSQAAASHTASLAGDDRIYEAVFKQTGIFRVNTLEELIEIAKGLAWQPSQRGKVAVLSNGGGLAVLATDALVALNVPLAEISSQTKARLGQLTPLIKRTNPLDILGDATPERYQIALEALLEQGDIQGVIVMQTPQILTDIFENSEKIVAVNKKWPNKFILSVCLSGEIAQAGVDILEKNKIPNYDDPFMAARVAQALVNF